MTKKKISELTPEQWERIYAEREVWRGIGTCTEPADRPTTEKILTKFYARLGREAPKFLWFDGPLQCCTDGPKAVNPKLSGAKLREEQQRIWSLRKWGCEWSWWVAHYVIIRDVVGVTYPKEQDELLEEWSELMKACGWFFPDEDVCYCAERHKSLKFDDRWLLHCADGPAIECRDAEKIYSWHGTTVPAEWIEAKDTIDPKLALTYPDIEKRRALAEILGWGRVLEQLEAKTINEDPEPSIGKLVEVELPDSGKERFLIVMCGTGRQFVLPVPSEMKTALEANAWTYNVAPDMLKELGVRT
jgi:hypothetical protein